MSKEISPYVPGDDSLRIHGDKLISSELEPLKKGGSNMKNWGILPFCLFVASFSITGLLWAPSFAPLWLALMALSGGVSIAKILSPPNTTEQDKLATIMGETLIGIENMQEVLEFFENKTSKEPEKIEIQYFYADAFEYSETNVVRDAQPEADHNDDAYYNINIPYPVSEDKGAHTCDSYCLAPNGKLKSMDIDTYNEYVDSIYKFFDYDYDFFLGGLEEDITLQIDSVVGRYLIVQELVRENKEVMFNQTIIEQNWSVWDKNIAELEALTYDAKAKRTVRTVPALEPRLSVMGTPNHQGAVPVVDSTKGQVSAPISPVKVAQQPVVTIAMEPWMLGRIAKDVPAKKTPWKL